MNDLVHVLNANADDLLADNKISIEELFKVYFRPSAVEQPYDYLLKQLIIKTSAIEAKSKFAESTHQAYPEGDICLTRALVYLISTYGMDKNHCLTANAIRLLRDPSVLELAHKNNHQLIYEINHAVQKLKDEVEIEKSKKHYRDFLLKNRNEFKKADDISKALSDSLIREARAFSRFFYYMKHPMEEEQMQAALVHLLEDFKSSNQERTVLHAYLCQGEHQWHFLNTVHGYLVKKNDLEGFIQRLNIQKEVYRHQEGKAKKIDAIDNLISELLLVDETHVAMYAKTESQSRWMMVAGAMFGMELSMLALEAIALMTPLSAWFILGVSAAACLVFGPYIALQFYTAHYDELMKMNQQNYFEEHLPPELRPNDKNDNCFWGTSVARIGTLEEGLAAGTLLLTLGAFAAFDLVSWGIKGGDYTLPIPGVYFVTEVVLQSTALWVPIVSAVAALVLLYMAYKATSALTNAHFALDGMKTIEYYDKRKEESSSRGKVSTTAGPLYFSKTLQWNDKISEKWKEFNGVEESVPNFHPC